MIEDQKHDQRLVLIARNGDAVHDSALDFMEILKRLTNDTGRNAHENLLKFERLIRNNKNG